MSRQQIHRPDCSHCSALHNVRLRLTNCSTDAQHQYTMNKRSAREAEACLHGVVAELHGAQDGRHHALVAPPPRHALEALRPQRVQADVQQAQTCQALHASRPRSQNRGFRKQTYDMHFYRHGDLHNHFHTTAVCNRTTRPPSRHWAAHVISQTIRQRVGCQNKPCATAEGTTGARLRRAARAAGARG